MTNTTGNQPLAGGPTVQGQIPVSALNPVQWQDFSETLGSSWQAAAALVGFAGEARQLALLPDGEGRLGRVLFGLGNSPDASLFRDLGGRLPAGEYFLEPIPDSISPAAIAVSFSLGAYRFDRYRKATHPPRLALPTGADPEEVIHVSHALSLARDMINTGANDMGPLQVETIAREIAEAHGATIQVTTGTDLLETGYPAVHAVGRAATAARAPRMIEVFWNGAGADAPLIAVVGKGVVFDSGGLDIKPTAGMRQMKKDMGGAAHALSLGRMIMAAKLPLRLAVLVPAVENAISGDAMRPGDVIASRKGFSIEVGNTDAEGRLILADALARASELEPELTIDLATLTGAARVALGPDLPPFYTDDETLAGEILSASAESGDPVWRMPLWSGYEPAIESDVADVTNEPEAWAQAGSITAALFLKRFAPKSGSWVHFDIFAWNPRGRPGWPKGAEVQAIRALYALIKGRYA
jgi:leucyl aminopeptidase